MCLLSYLLILLVPFPWALSAVSILSFADQQERSLHRRWVESRIERSNDAPPDGIGKTLGDLSVSIEQQWLMLDAQWDDRNDVLCRRRRKGTIAASSAIVSILKTHSFIVVEGAGGTSACYHTAAFVYPYSRPFLLLSHTWRHDRLSPSLSCDICLGRQRHCPCRCAACGFKKH